MMRRVPIILLVALLALPVTAQDEDALVERDARVPGEVLVRFAAGAPAPAVLRAARAVGARHVQSFPAIGVRHWRLPPGLDVDRAVERLERHPHVLYAEANHVVRAHVLPDDARLVELWGMHNVGQTGGTMDADIDAPEAWDLATDASSVVVGIIDTGIDLAHEDLAANLWTNPGEIAGNGVDDDGNGYVDDVHGYDFVNDDGDPSDDNGHGTHTAGTVGAVGANGLGVTGVCWSARLMALKFLDGGGRGSNDDAIAAVLYAASFLDATGAPIVRVTNNSWGGGHRSKALEDAIAAAGALFVASAGNSGSSRRQYPAGYDLDVIVSVAATDHDDLLAGFSNFGGTVDLAAPGVATLSCVLGDAYGTKSGTSMAAPHVAGAAALALAHRGGSLLDAKAWLLGGVDAVPGLEGLVVTGGRLNVLRTLGGTPPAPPADDTPPAAVTDLAVDAAATTARSLTVTWTATADDGNAGEAAAAYDLRYATEPIDEASWDAATPAVAEPLPGAPGTAESHIVQDLDPETTYHLALKVMDAAGNVSALSNAVSAATAVAPPSAWTVEVVDTVGGFYKGLGFDPTTGYPGAAYSEGDTVQVSLWDGSAWVKSTAENNTNDGAGTDFAFSPDGVPSVSYGWGKLHFGEQLAGTWETAVCDRARANNDYTSLVYDALGRPTIAYRTSGNNGELRLARRVGGAWEAETVEPAGARYTHLVFDGDGHPVIAYSDDLAGDGWLDTLKIARFDGTDWQIEVVETGTVGYGVHARVGIDPATGALVAAHAANGSIRFARQDATDGSWSVEVVGSGGGIGLVVDDAGVVWLSANAGGVIQVIHDDPLSPGWVLEEVDPLGQGRTALELDVDGHPAVLYGRRGGGIKLARRLP